jgi:hypothetical protein
MRKRRVARRIALTKQVNNRCTQAVSAQTLATKVLHLSLQPFSSGGWAVRRRLVAPTEYPRVAGGHVRDLPCRAGGATARRFAWPPVSSLTPFTKPSLATNDAASEVAQ